MYKKGQTGTFRYVTRESIYFVLSMKFPFYLMKRRINQNFILGEKNVQYKTTMNSKHCKKITYNLYKPVKT